MSVDLGSKAENVACHEELPEYLPRGNHFSFEELHPVFPHQRDRIIAIPNSIRRNVKDVLGIVK